MAEILDHDVEETGFWDGDLVKYLKNVRDLVNELQADNLALNNYVDYLSEEDGVIGGDFTIVAGAATTLTGAGHIRYRLGGTVYFIVLDTTIALTDDGDVDDSKWRAWRIEIDKLGIVTATADGDTQHTNQEDSMLSLASTSRTAATVTIGYFNINSNGGFAVGDANVNGETDENVFVVRAPIKQIAGLTAAMSVDLAIGSTNTSYSTGTRDYMVNGLNVAQDSAETDKSFDDNDTVGQDQFGGWLIVTNLANSATYSLASDGVAGSVSAMAHATAALASTAIDNVESRLPSVFAPVGRIILTNNKSGAFTANTDDMAGTDGTPVYTSSSFGTWDRTVTGFDSHQINPPTIPAALTITATLTLLKG